MSMRLFLATAVMLTMSYVTGAQSGKVAMTYASLPTNPVELAMGGVRSFNASMDDVMDIEAGYMMFSPSFSPVSYMTLRAGYNLQSKIRFTLDGAYGMCEEYEMFNSSGLATGTYKPSQVRLGVGAHYHFADMFGAGIKLKYYREALAPQARYGAFASDVIFFADIPLSSSMSLYGHAGVIDLGTKVKSVSGKSFSLPASAQLSVGYKSIIGERNVVNVSVQGDCYFHNDFALSAGASYMYNDMISLRAGYHLGAMSVLPSFASIGLGLHLFGLDLDLAYLIAEKGSAAANSLCVSLGYSF